MKISLQNINYKNHNLQKSNKHKASSFDMPKKATSSLDSFSNYNKADVNFKGIEQDFYSRQKDFIERLKTEIDENGLLVFYYDFLKSQLK